jgi:hypothetical protein
MRDYSRHSDPDRNRNFRRRWTATCPPSSDEIRLATLRQRLGNAAGTRQFAKELHGKRLAGGFFG